MQGLNKSLKIFFKRYKYILLGLLVGFLLAQGAYTRSQYSYITETIGSDIKNADKILENWNSKMPLERVALDKDQKIKPFKSSDFEKLSEYERKIGADKKEMPISEKFIIKSDKYGDLSYGTAKFLNPDKNLLDAGKLLNESYIGFIILSFVISFLLSSDFLTGFYKFVRQIPVKKENIYLSKIIFGIGVILVFYMTTILLRYGLLMQTPMKDALFFKQFLPISLMVLLRTIAVFLVSFGVGTLAGNVLGFVGLMIIAFAMNGVLESWSWLLRILSQNNFMFTTKWGVFYKEYFDTFAGYFINAIYHITEGKNLVYIALLALIYFVIGYIVTKVKDGSRITKCIEIKSISEIIKVIAIVTTTAVAALIISDILNSSILVYPIVAIIGYFCYKFYKMLFELSIGF